MNFERKDTTMNLQSATFETGIAKIRQTIEQNDRLSGLRIVDTNVPYDTMVFNHRTDGRCEMVKIVLFKYSDGFMADQFLAKVYIEDIKTGAGYYTNYGGKTRYAVFKQIDTRFHA